MESSKSANIQYLLYYLTRIKLSNTFIIWIHSVARVCICLHIRFSWKHFYVENRSFPSLWFSFYFSLCMCVCVWIFLYVIFPLLLLTFIPFSAIFPQSWQAHEANTKEHFGVRAWTTQGTVGGTILLFAIATDIIEGYKIPICIYILYIRYT